MWSELMQYRHAEGTRRPNYLLTPVTVFTFCDEDIKQFNRIYKFAITLNMMERTSKGTICYSNYKRLPCHYITVTTSVVEIIIYSGKGIWRFQLRNKHEKKLYGRRSFTRLKKELLKDGINIEDYYIQDGQKVKETIESPLIDLNSEEFVDRIWDNAHHIDFHSSYPAGLCNTHPEFRPTISRIYAKRKEKESYKAILNHSIGFMQSKMIGFKLAHLSRDAIKDNNDRIRELSKRLEKNGNIIIAYNVDGIWYSGPIYHGEGEGDDLGQWRNDHINCKLRFKSKGAYEFIEDGVYTPVVRGFTKFDFEEERYNWKWGDIYKSGAQPFTYKLDPKKGIVREKNG